MTTTSEDSNWDVLLIMLHIPLLHKMEHGKYMFTDIVSNEPVYRMYDRRENRYYMATHERARFRVAFDELAYEEPAV